MSADYIADLAAMITASPAPAKAVALATVTSMDAVSVSVQLVGADTSTQVLAWSDSFKLAMAASDVTGRTVCVLMIDGQPVITDAYNYGGTT